MSRLDRELSASPQFTWNDRGRVASAPAGLDAGSVERGPVLLPASYCRHCGRTGWTTLLDEVDGRMTHHPATVRNKSLEQSARIRVLLAAHPSEVGAHWYDPVGRRLHTVDEAEYGLTPSSKTPNAVCVLPTENDAEGKSQTCPSCKNDDAIRFLGTQVASLASVAIGELFGSPDVDVDERKLLAFTDSVQDAAHRASFFTARTYRFNLRTLMSTIVREHDGEIGLDALETLVFNQAHEDGPKALFGVIPADLRSDRLVKTVWGETPHSKGLAILRDRLALETALEFGMSARLGRTLELTRSAVANVQLGDEAELIDAFRGSLAQQLARADAAEPANLHNDQTVVIYLRGVAERLRLRGAVFSALLRAVRPRRRQGVVAVGRPPSRCPGIQTRPDQTQVSGRRTSHHSDRRTRSSIRPHLTFLCSQLVYRLGSPNRWLSRGQRAPCHVRGSKRACIG